MCGRFTLRTPTGVMAAEFELEMLPPAVERYNIAPSQTIAAVRIAPESESRQLVQLRWGLVPPWAQDPSVGNQMINARSETAATKPAFREALRKRRCLIPADGFYEWQKTGGRKQPYFIHRPDNRLFAFAGLWERWQHRDTTIESCTVLTTSANDRLGHLHHRMPVILGRADYATWLNPEISDPASLQPLMRPCADDFLTLDPVSPRVNSAQVDDALCLEKVEEQKTLF